MTNEATMESTRPLRCTECNEPLESPVGCFHCHSVFPVHSELTHFDRLGLPESFHVRLDKLDKKYLAWSRELHPDYFQLKGAEERQLSQDLSAALNDAYATLKDPFRRAEYLLSLMGGPTAAECRDMPEEFLEEVLELRMAIAEANESATEGNRAKIDAIATRLTSERSEAMAQIGELFTLIEKSDDEQQNEPRVRQVRRLLNTIKYLDGLLRDLSE